MHRTETEGLAVKGMSSQDREIKARGCLRISGDVMGCHMTERSRDWLSR